MKTKIMLWAMVAAVLGAGACGRWTEVPCEVGKSYPCECTDGTDGTALCGGNGRNGYCTDAHGNACDKEDGAGGGSCIVPVPSFDGGGAPDQQCIGGDHTTSCIGAAGSDGLCDPKTQRCCVGYDVDCCAGCLTDETVCGTSVDVCLDRCPDGQSCGASDGRCHPTGK